MADTTQTAIPGVIAYVMSSDAGAAIEFYRRAFDAGIVGEIMRMEDGKRVMHCQLSINGGAFMLGDAMPEYGYAWQAPQGTTLTLAVAEPRKWWDRAVAAGCEVTMPLEVAFWGDLYGQVKDPFGHAWAIVGPPDGK